MARPLVTTTGTAMAEVSGDAAVLVAPGRCRDLADALGGPRSTGRIRGRGHAVAVGLEVAAALHLGAAAPSGHMDAYRWAVDRATGRDGPGADGVDR